MPANSIIPKPLFETLDPLCELYKRCQIGNQEEILKDWLYICLSDSINTLPQNAIHDYGHALRFLYSYRGSFETFNSYRREIDRLLQWSWFIEQKSILELKRLDIEHFIEFCGKPPKRWIGFKMVSRFITKDDVLQPNPEWRPFIAKISKKAFQDGERPTKASFELSQQGIKQIFAILGSFYNALIQEEVTEVNPVIQIRQKSKFIRKTSATPMIRRLSEKQWQMVFGVTKELAEQNPTRCHAPRILTH